MPSAQQGFIITSSAQLGTGVVTSDAIALDVVTAVDIAANAVGDSEIAAHTTTKITMDASLMTGAVPIANGGTGQTAKEAAFDALSPLVSQGDTMHRNSTVNTRLVKGTALQIYRMNSGATAPEWATLSAAALVGKTITNVVVGNTAVETDLVSFTLPANFLSTTNVVHLRVLISNFENGGAGTGQFRGYIGTTAIATGNITVTTNPATGYVDLYIVAGATTSAQELWLISDIMTNGLIGNTAATIFHAGFFGTAAEDSTGALTVKLTWQWSGADVPRTITSAGGFLNIYR